MRCSSNRIRIGAAILPFVCVCYFWLAWGVYSDREFGGLYLFAKHRLSFRFFFSAPLGETDRDISTLSESGRRAENAFQEFVETHGGYERGRRHQILQ